jgi:hypothetical protein
MKERWDASIGIEALLSPLNFDSSTEIEALATVTWQTAVENPERITWRKAQTLHASPR